MRELRLDQVGPAASVKTRSSSWYTSSPNDCLRLLAQRTPMSIQRTRRIALVKFLLEPPNALPPCLLEKVDPSGNKHNADVPIEPA